MTFEEIAEMDPRIARLHRLATMIARKKVDSFCANAIWYTLFKPRLEELVGWQRKINSKGLKFYTIQQLTNGDMNKDFVHDKGPLGTSEAYSIAYEKIYNALPDCGPNCCV